MFKKLIVGLIIAIAVIAGLLTLTKNHQAKSTATPAANQGVLTKEQQQAKTPEQALARLKAGNQRFISGAIAPANYANMVTASKDSQHPAAVVLSCIDSRVPPEIIFDQAIGNIFVSRVAASVISPDILGGMEYATHVAGAKVIVVLGHENCGAVKAACQNVQLGHITGIVKKIQPAVAQAQAASPNASCSQQAYVDQIARDNVLNIVKEIPQQSAILKEEVASGKIKIVGAMYHIDTGEVEFLS